MHERELSQSPREKTRLQYPLARIFTLVVLAIAAEACEKTANPPPEESNSPPTADFIDNTVHNTSGDDLKIEKERKVRIYQLSLPAVIPETQTPHPTATQISNVNIPTPYPQPLVNSSKAREINSETIIDGESKLQEASAQASEIIQIINAHRSETPLLVGTKPLEKGLENLPVYFPIYLAGQEEYDVPWFQLWIMHGVESTFSLDSKAFNGYYQGPTQRDPNFFPDEEVYQASASYEYLATIPTNHPNLEPPEWRELLWTAYRTDFLWKEMGSLKGALYRYCDPASCADMELASFKAWQIFFDRYLPQPIERPVE